MKLTLFSTIVHMHSSCDKFVVNATDPKRVMASHDQLRLSCYIDVEDEFKHNEELFWKLCEWINPKGEVCSQTITDDQRKKETCASSFGNVTIEQCGERNRLKCCLNIPTVEEKDKGRWKCKLHKCKDIENGGCSSKSPSICSDEILVYVAVIRDVIK